ncbi:MAG: hypothetical protein K8S56_04255 [Candidatus Cloacimonetes bacterium]|nr:hypothetical protein [Candidatus Cloacimonadota bacterium]
MVFSLICNEEGLVKAVLRNTTGMDIKSFSSNIFQFIVDSGQSSGYTLLSYLQIQKQVFSFPLTFYIQQEPRTLYIAGNRFENNILLTGSDNKDLLLAEYYDSLNSFVKHIPQDNIVIPLLLMSAIENLTQ